ncbi:MAG: 6-bladed beta-propeller [Candidatus Polarisedimenticolaceae bacterium]|nr:6-bladed beta-propeller [Candidatus Polarisedimenticolaceae bacterium]
MPSTLFMLVFFISITAVADEHAEESGRVDIVWPASPQEPKIRYIRSIATSDDMATEKGFFGKLLEFIIGPDDVVDLVKPMGLAVNSAGKLFVADPAGKRIHIFDIVGQDYSSIEEVNDKLFVLPIGVSVDDQDNLYVVDGGLRKIFKFNRDGKFITAFGDESLQRPTGIAIDSKKKLLYVVDTPAHNVKVYSLESGAMVATLGERGTEDGTFNFPSYAAIDAKGALYITDGMNKKVRVFGADREYQRAVGKPGDGSGSFSAPKGVAVDSDGNLYVADVAFDNVQIFDAEGRLLMAFGSPGQAPGKFWMPTGLFIDKSDRIYVADSYNKRIQIFQYLGAEKR